MNKEGKIPKNNELEYLNQLISTLEGSVERLEDFYEEKNYENFDKTRKFISEIFAKIAEVTKS